MLKYVDAGGATFEGATPVEVVRSMHNASWGGTSKQEYMRQVSRRVKVLGATVDPRSAQKFLDTLEATGWLRKVE